MSQRTLLFSSGVLIAVGVALAGCTSGGHAVPASADASAAVESTGGCARSAEPVGCVEWTETAVDTGDKLVATATDNPEAAARMVCSALSDAQWASFLGKDFYRYLQAGGVCSVSSQNNQLLIRAMVVTGTSWAQYLAANERDKDTITSFDLDGRSVMRAAPPSTTDGIGEDAEDLTISTGEDVTRPWVLRVQVLLHQPRGEAAGTPVDRSRLGFRDALIDDLLTSLFPYA